MLNTEDEEISKAYAEYIAGFTEEELIINNKIAEEAEERLYNMELEDMGYYANT